jgi:hypothetical protein
MLRKRKMNDEDDQDEEYLPPRTKIVKRRTKLADAPPIESIKTLIEMGNSGKLYKNIDNLTLWRITPHLEELDSLIALDELKKTILLQILYYLQGMNTRNVEGDYLHTAVYGGAGMAKCLAKNTPVMLYDGRITFVQNIKQHDLLMGDDGTPRKVLSTCHGTDKLYQVGQPYGLDYTVNKTHILTLQLTRDPILNETPDKFTLSWYCREGYFTREFSYLPETKEMVKSHVNNLKADLPKTGSTIDIPIEEYLAKPVIWKNTYQGYKASLDFSRKQVDIDPYLFGYLFHYWQFPTKQKIRMFLQKANRWGSTKRIRKHKAIVREFIDNFITNDRTGRIRNRYHAARVLAITIFKHKRFFNCCIPDSFKTTDRQTRLKLLAGFIDHHGYLDQRKICCLAEPSLAVTSDLVWIAKSLGMFTEVFVNQSNNKYIICICGKIDEIPCKIRSKQGVRTNVLLTNKLDIKEAGRGEYYGFELDGNGRFLLGDFTVTHNTTVSKIIGKLYQAMGILSPDGGFKIAYRDDLVAGYLGQTALKTKKFLNSCLGGVVFIDEVYSLAPRNNDRDSFSKEAIDTLNAFLSEHKNDFCCIIAGYEDEVTNCFFSMNRGLVRRFPWVHRIEPYTPTHLAEIFKKMLKDSNWSSVIEDKWLVEFFHKNKDMFKNAGGDVETFISKCKIFHSKRVFTLSKKEKYILNQSDVNEALAYWRKNYTVKEDKPPDGIYM